MADLVHATPEYSNAALVAIMPLVSDFAAKMELPIPQPITVSQIARAIVHRLKCPVGAGIWLTNGYWFVFQSLGTDPLHGYVMGYSAPTNAFREQEFSDKSIPRCFRTSRMTTNEAIALARATLLKAGYEFELGGGGLAFLELLGFADETGAFVEVDAAGGGGAVGVVPGDGELEGVTVVARGRGEGGR